MRYCVHIRVLCFFGRSFLLEVRQERGKGETREIFPLYSGGSGSLLVLSVEYVQALVPMEDVPSGRAPTFFLEGAKHIHETSMGY